VLSTQITMSNPKQFCIEADADATRTFGRSIAINDQYLAISDGMRNKVNLYTPDDSGGWQKTREILPPADLALGPWYSAPFGTSLELDGDILTISAKTMNPEWYRKGRSQSLKEGIAESLYWRYLTNLKTETPLELIDLLVEPEPESDRVRFNLLRQGKIEQFILPNMGKSVLGSNGVYKMVALDENRLLVGYLSENEAGGAYLFDLARPEAEPIELSIEDTDLGRTIAISQQFAVVGSDRFNYQLAFDSRPRWLMTLIRNLENGATNTIKSFGKVSLSGNILAVMKSHSDGIYSFIEVFRLDENANAHLITKRTVHQGEVQNGFLFTQKYDDSKRICIEPLPKN
ncbi:MAG: hypothetical protein AAFY63_23455, partial [Cyanobacteria bacterium J06643_13]